MKGEGVARAEGLSTTNSVSLEITLNVTPDNRPPSPPVQFVATPVGCSGVTISWQAPTDVGALGVSGYQLYLNGIPMFGGRSPWTYYVYETTNCFSLIAVGVDNLTSQPAIACANVEVPDSAQARPVAVLGANFDCQRVLPEGLSNTVAVAAGGAHTLALKTDGTIIAWGANTFGQTNVVTGASNVVAVAAGGSHNLALRPDGTVLAWGNDYWGQIDVPEGLSNVVAIAGGSYHSLALKADGTIVAWGDSSGTNAPAGLSNVVAIAAGDSHSLALKADGKVVAFGYNGSGQTNVPTGLSNVTAIAAGKQHSLALKADRTIVAWGDNNFGQRQTPAGLSNVVSIAAGGYHNLALKADGTVVAFGSYWSGSFFPATAPVGLSNVIAMAAGGYHSAALIGQIVPIRIRPPGRDARAGNTFRISVPTVRGKHYRLEYKNNLADSHWTLLSPVPGDGTDKILVDLAAFGQQRFYRIHAQ